MRFLPRIFAVAIIGCMSNATTAQESAFPPLYSRADDPAYLQHLDEHSPFAEPGAPLPGRAIAQPNGLTQWEGKLGWRTRQGPAVVVWSTGQALDIFNALYPDGSRGGAAYMLDRGWRRLSSDRTRWIYGTIDIRADDVVFTDGEQPRYDPPPLGVVPNLEAELARDAAFLADLRDKRFARGVYSTFMNGRFRKAGSTRVWSCGDRQAAYIVAYLRDRGESYHDYFLDYEFTGLLPSRRAERLMSIEALQLGNKKARDAAATWTELTMSGQSQDEKTGQAEEFSRLLRETEASFEQGKKRVYENADVFERLEEHLTRLGWHWITTEETQADRLAALRAIKQFEARSEGPRPEWSSKFHEPKAGALSFVVQPPATASDEERELARGRPLRDRVLLLAISGRISRDEFDQLMDWT